MPEPAPNAARAFRPARRTSLVDDIADQLLALILQQEPGESALPSERELCDQLGVSRGPVREAISALHHLGVIETRGKTRYGRPDRALAQTITRATAGAPARALVDDPMEVRRILEPATAALAASRIDAEALAELERWLDRMEEVGRRGEVVVEYDSAFHVGIARATGNAILADLVTSLTETVVTSRATSFAGEAGFERSLGGHREILAALRARDPEAARAAMQRHLDDVERLIRERLAADHPNSA